MKSKVAKKMIKIKQKILTYFLIGDIFTNEGG